MLKKFNDLFLTDQFWNLEFAHKKQKTRKIQFMCESVTHQQSGLAASTVWNNILALEKYTRINEFVVESVRPYKLQGGCSHTVFTKNMLSGMITIHRMLTVLCAEYKWLIMFFVRILRFGYHQTKLSWKNISLTDKTFNGFLVIHMLQ